MQMLRVSLSMKPHPNLDLKPDPTLPKDPMQLALLCFLLMYGLIIHYLKEKYVGGFEYSLTTPCSEITEAHGNWLKFFLPARPKPLMNGSQATSVTL